MFKHILVPLDGSSLAENVLPHVVAFARAFEARCTLLRVLRTAADEQQVQPIDPLYWRMHKAEAQAYLETQADRLRAVEPSDGASGQGLEVNRVVLEGQAAERIVEFAQGNAVDLIMMSSHGQSGLSRWNVSSVVHKTIQRAKISAMITRAYRPTPEAWTDLRYRRLMLPLDGSQRAECALAHVTTLTRFHNAQLLVAHVVVKPEVPRRAPATEEETELTEQLIERNRQRAVHYIEQLKTRLPIQFEPHLLVSDAVPASLHDFVENQQVDLVIMCAHGYSGRRKWPYGSVTTTFIEYGATPLLIVQDMPPEEVELTEAELAAKEQKGR